MPPKRHISLLVTCEHGGNDVPTKYRQLFRPHRDLLRTHRGYDIGALVLARDFAESLRAPFIWSTTTRLLVELNRSQGHRSLFSAITRDLSRDAKSAILEEHYFPYRKRVEDVVSEAADVGKPTVHLSVHTFTPVLGEDVRNADVGFLYDPSRAGERRVVDRWFTALSGAADALRIRRNYPYRGTADGFTTALRRKYSDRLYAGLELEVNQRFPLGGKGDWKRIRRALVESLQEVLGDLD